MNERRPGNKLQKMSFTKGVLGGIRGITKNGYNQNKWLSYEKRSH